MSSTGNRSKTWTGGVQAGIWTAKQTDRQTERQSRSHSAALSAEQVVTLIGIPSVKQTQSGRGSSLEDSNRVKQRARPILCWLSNRSYVRLGEDEDKIEE